MIDFSEFYPTGVCGWCHEQIPATMERYVRLGNACNDCEFRFGHVVDNSAKWSDYTSADAIKDLEFRFMYNHVNNLCVSPTCDYEERTGLPSIIRALGEAEDAHQRGF